jgi:hypothetical protein
MTHHIHVQPELGMELGSYVAGFKVRVIKYTDKTNSCSAARKFSVVEANVQKWRLQKQKLINVN